MRMEAFLLVAWPVLLAVLAAGAVLLIKIARRRQATRAGRFGGAVPARPMSAEHAARLSRRYWWTAGVVVAVLAAFGIGLLLGG